MQQTSVFDSLHALTASVQASARQIDQTFAAAAERLGQGLALFETLNKSLSALSAELASDHISVTCGALQGLADDLRALGDRLPVETQILRDITGQSGVTARILKRLLGCMRTITLLSRRARIEAVTVQSDRHDLDDFSHEVAALTAKAQSTIERCTRDHDRLTNHVRAAMAAQREVETRYRDVLAQLAERLEQALTQLDDRRRRSVALNAEAEAHAKRVSIRMGDVFVAMQAGDSVRQRLEHALSILQIALDVDAGAAVEGGFDAAADRAAIAVMLRRLQAAQLRSTSGDLSASAREVQAALRALSADTADLIGVGAALYRSGDASSSSFLQKLETEIGEACDLLKKCGAARATVDRVTEALTEMLDQFRPAIAALLETVSSIVLIGMNAGLKAGRLGDNGRTLVVIAQELRIAADLIAQDADGLGPAFALIHQHAARLRARDHRHEAYLSAVDQTVRAALASTQQGGLRFNQALDRLSQDGATFTPVVAQAQGAFSDVAATGAVIAAAAAALEQDEPAPMILAFAQGKTYERFMTQRIWPHYTMDVERTIHRTFLDSGGAVDRAAQADEKAPEAALEDFLF